MYQLEWSSDGSRAAKSKGAVYPSRVDAGEVKRVYLALWEEHCVECAVPECYAVCPLYVPRRDRKCARFRGGIYPNPEYSGMYPFGADISFRRWGKLEAKLEGRIVSLNAARRRQATDRNVIALLNPVSTALSILSPSRRLNGAYHEFRDWQLQNHSEADLQGRIDELLIEVWNPSSESCRLIVECFRDQVLSRHALVLNPGHNLQRIPYAELGVDVSRHGGKMYLYPDHDAEVRLIFTWLALVGYQEDHELTAVRSSAPNQSSHSVSPSNGSSAESAPPQVQQPPMDMPVQDAPAKALPKIKCVVWDLDNTLWAGTLAEDGPDACKLRPGIRELIEGLDARGIIQSIASRNDHQSAWALVERMGIQEYFVYPMINWGPKSRGLEQIAQELNINLDTLAFVDDMAPERAQITQILPQVRVYAETDTDKLLARPEFDVPVTSESKLRRLSYLAEAQRKNVAAGFAAGNEDFLRSCQLVAELFTPADAGQAERCLELLQRSNQLNLTSRRYERSAFENLMADAQKVKIALACHDKFGDYGTVGFACVDFSGQKPLLQDFVMSCRVAKKHVENAFFAWLMQTLGAMGNESLQADFLATERNGVLRSVLDEVGFLSRGESGKVEHLELSRRTIVWADIVEVRERELQPQFEAIRGRLNQAV